MSIYPESQTYLLPSNEEIHHEGSSCTGWIIAFIIFLLVAIGLGVWLLVLYLGGHVGSSSSDRIVSLQGASITANATSITGSWGTLNNENDKVTLYVSEKPFVFNDNGEIVDNSGQVQNDSQTGSNNKITISTNINMNTSYNAIMIVTGDNTVHYRIYGPKRVFTQVQANIVGSLFSIRDLNSCNGAVSNTASFTTSPLSAGTYRLGAPSNTNPDSKSLLVRYDSTTEAETEQVLCRVPTSTQLTQISYGYWVNRNSTGLNDKPVICTAANGDNDLTAIACTGTNNTQISLENCQWSYNTDPTTMAGLNQWCLSALGSTTLNSNIREPLCLSRNGPTSLAVTNGLINTDTWFNSIIVPPTTN